MNGLLVVNGFLKGEKYDRIYSMLTDAFVKRGVGLTTVANTSILAEIGFEKKPRADFALFWDKDVKLAEYLEKSGYRVFNSAATIGTCDDKAKTFLSLMNKNIAMPETILPPFTFDNIGYSNYDFIDEAAEKLGYPMVIKECFGSFGREVYLVENRADAVRTVKNIGVKPFLFQKPVETSFGKDVRVQTAGNTIVASVMRVAKNGEFAANVTNGGKMYPYDLSIAEKKLVFDVIKALNLDFGGIDLLFGRDEPLLCEVNTNAHFKNLYDATGINAADNIAEYIINAI